MASQRQTNGGDECLPLRDLIELLPDIALVVSPTTGVILAGNAAAQAAYGYTHDELLCLHIGDLRAQDNADVVADQLARADSGGIRFEAVHRRKGGSTFPVEVHARGTTTGGERQVLSVIRDITERRRSVAALAASEDRYRSLVDHLGVGLFRAVLDGPIQQANPALLRLLGYTSMAELLTLTPGRLWQDHQALERFFAVVRAEGRVADFAGTLLRKDGSPLPVSISAVVVRDVPGGPAVVLGTVEDRTERERREQALRESERKFSQVFHGSPACLSITTLAEGRIVDVNEAMLRLAGMDRAAVIGRTVIEIGFWGDPEDSRRIRERVLAEGSVTAFETTFKRKSGETWCGWLYATVIDLEGRPCLLSELIDVTDRVRAEVSLRESELRFRATFEQAFVGIAHLGLDGRWLRVNQRLCDLLGYSREELLARGYQGLTHPDDLAQDTAAVRQLARGELREYLREKRYVRKDGSVVWVSLVSTLVRNEQGEPQYLSTFLQDISERKIAEEALDLIKTSMDRAPVPTYCLAADGAVVYVNDAGCAQSGYERHELLRLGARDLFAGSTPVRWAEVFAAVKAQGSIRLERTGCRKDGTRLPLEITSWYLKHGEHEYCLGFAVDLTDRLRAQHERDVLQEQLSHSQRLESVGRLAGGVAHDFNNMLTVIQVSVQQALESVDSAHPIHSDLTHISVAATRSAELTRQLLAFARKQTITPRLLDLNQAIEGMLKMLRRLLGEDLELTWRPAANLWPVLMDPAQVDQVLANLCVNARDAITDVGKVCIETANQSVERDFCASHPAFVPGEYVRVCVSDDGCGMDAETQTHIFEPFFTTKADGKGTGLGLATVYGIVSQNQGFLDVISAPGQGTSFSVYLPRQTATPDVATARPSRPPCGGRETVLVVEDEVRILKLMTRQVEKLGYHVLPTHSPSEALRIACEHKGEIHLLLTDVVMPEMNGRHLANKLLAIHPGMRCLFVSGYTADIIAHHGAIEPGIALIQKPFTSEELASKVRQVLDEQRDG